MDTQLIQFILCTLSRSDQLSRFVTDVEGSDTEMPSSTEMIEGFEMYIIPIPRGEMRHIALY